MARAVRMPSLLLIAAIACLALALASLALPSGATYDPYAWLIWGRDLAHMDLATGGTGTSWKPLPALLDALLTPLGGGAARGWLVVARAGALFAVFMSFRLAWRLAPREGGGGGAPDGAAGGAGGRRRDRRGVDRRDTGVAAGQRDRLRGGADGRVRAASGRAASGWSSCPGLRADRGGRLGPCRGLAVRRRLRRLAVEDDWRQAHPLGDRIGDADHPRALVRWRLARLGALDDRSKPCPPAAD